MESIGLKIKGDDKTRPFLEFVDHKGRIRAKIHPSDKATEYSHLHIYDKDGNPMTSVLDVIVGKKGYIPKQSNQHLKVSFFFMNKSGQVTLRMEKLSEIF